MTETTSESQGEMQAVERENAQLRAENRNLQSAIDATAVVIGTPSA